MYIEYITGESILLTITLQLILRGQVHNMQIKKDRNHKATFLFMHILPEELILIVIEI